MRTRVRAADAKRGAPALLSGVRAANDSNLEQAGTGKVGLCKGESMRKKISQREALRLRRKVRELESTLDDLRCGWCGTRIDSWTLTDTAYAKVSTAKALGFTTIISPTYTGNGAEIKAVKL